MAIVCSVEVNYLPLGMHQALGLLPIFLHGCEIKSGSGLGITWTRLGVDPFMFSSNDARPHPLADHALWKAGRGGATSGVIASLAEAVGYEAF